ncbi:hypothetical protein RhiirA5_380233 [Rhizophagus irregularis]|uniref:Uncharacterized protein n=1 Tax=Rhizophagus irregularis TaxID=588596 RepID=A0A2I1F7M4_9GLOM|nr:hypothetical protein RhiirA5_380233 [Rhizophagus irregularis]PKC57991.1 hypothetical protein RhiirA1_496794 [Rhizophagus irregularis]PKY30365.1 hypothetical protein RhiirB3_486180 [Rhizophagus irregularis]CAB4473744.1 unnamed protein product [Rhizophagus irregularis]CAB5213230.1 unnamed protein product [Rhizophagus irregularis]
MLWYLRSDATHLSAEDIQDIIKAKNSMKRASEAMANKYKISTRRVYQIWRGTHPPIDPKDIKPISEEPGSYQQVDPVKCNAISENKVKKTGGKKPKFKSVSISEPTINQNQPIPGTKKEIISLTESSEDVLDLYKRTDNTLEEIKASGHPLISK